MATIDNQIICMEYLRDNLGWTDYQCAALVGCMIAESNINPSAINKGEKNGTLKSSGANNEGKPYGDKHCPWSYGAGIIQWTYTNRKENALMLGLGIQKDKAVTIIKGSGIEALPLDHQLKMVCAEITKGNYKDNFKIVIEKCENLKEAVAAVYCRYLGGYSSKTTIPTDSDISRLDKNYNIANQNSVSGFYIRLKYATQVLENYHHSIDI